MSNKEDLFSRCSYDIWEKGMSTPVKRVYILRCGCSAFDALDQVEEDYKYDAPDGCDTRVTAKTVVRDDLGGKCLVTHMIEYVNQTGEVVFKISNMSADNRQYSMEYLIANPELLPDGDVDSFVAAYKHYDEVKAGNSYGELTR